MTEIFPVEELVGVGVRLHNRPNHAHEEPDAPPDGRKNDTGSQSTPGLTFRVAIYPIRTCLTTPEPLHEQKNCGATCKPDYSKRQMEIPIA